MSRTPTSNPENVDGEPQEPSDVLTSPVSDLDTVSTHHTSFIFFRSFSVLVLALMWHHYWQVQSGNLCQNFSARLDEEYADSVEFGDPVIHTNFSPSVANPFDVLNDPYSPSDPAYVY
jgi:hypothetical protein